MDWGVEAESMVLGFSNGQCAYLLLYLGRDFFLEARRNQAILDFLRVTEAQQETHSNSNHQSTPSEQTQVSWSSFPGCLISIDQERPQPFPVPFLPSVFLSKISKNELQVLLNVLWPGSNCTGPGINA